MTESIIHFSSDDYWNSNPHSRYHITKNFVELGYKVLWINPLGTRFPSIKKKNFSNRIIRKLKSIFKFLKKADDNFYVYTPVLLPVFSRGFYFNLNKIIFHLQISFITAMLGIKKPVLFFSTPLYAFALNLIGYSKSIYYYSDYYTAYRELNNDSRKYLEYLDNLLYKNSDIIYCASKEIYSNLTTKNGRGNIYYLPHAVDFEHFNTGRKGQIEIPSDLKSIKHPIIGYYGTLTDSNDWDVIEYCSKERPDYNFVFIGRKDISLPKLEKRSNIFFTGKKTYDELPAYALQFDVCIMFWVRRDWIKNSSPLKLNEYLSLGKPVVSTLIEEVNENYREIVYSAKTKEQFLEHLDSAVMKNNSERIEKGLKIVRGYTWRAVAEKILSNDGEPGELK